MTPQEKLMAGRLKAKQLSPYLASALYALVPRQMDGLGTIGVTKDCILLWDPAALAKWSVEEAAAALVHECWHLLRKHFDRCEKMTADAAIWNQASDCEINDDLVKSGFKFPGGYGLLPKTYDLQDGLTAEYYYAEIRKKQPPQQSGGSGDQGDPQDGGNKQGKSGGQGKPAVGQGWCGSAAGRAVPDEPEGGSAGGRTEAEVERVRKQVARSIQQEAAKGRGNLPAGMARWADSQLAPPTVPWQKKLARAAKQAVAYKMGAVDYRYDHLSRRQGGIGYGPGKPILPALRQPVPEVWIVADTSGSMGKEELTIALREATGVLKATGAPVTFVAADAAVHSLKKVSRWEDIVPLLIGGGGTDFCPVFEAASAPRSGLRPDILIFATDGDGRCPPTPPDGMHVIWLLTGKHAHSPCTWGDQIRVEA